MSDSTTILAKVIGTPWGGDLDEPFGAGHPTAGERVSIFAFEVLDVDNDSSRIHTYHLAGPDKAHSGALTPGQFGAEGDTTRWIGYGTGTVVSPPAPHGADNDRLCEVSPDEAGLPPD